MATTEISNTKTGTLQGGGSTFHGGDHRTLTNWNIGETWQARNFPALKLAQPVRTIRWISTALLWALPTSLVVMMWAPWQQSVTGSGRVVTYDPNHRLQEVDAPIAGRITNIRADLVEGAIVNKGDALMDIEVIDSALIFRLEEQLMATHRKLETEKTIVIAYEQQVEAFKAIRSQTELAQDEFIKMAGQKLLAEQQSLKAAKAAYEQAEKDRIRRIQLFEQKVESRYEVEVAERKAQEEEAKLAQAQAYVEAAKSELSAKEAERLYKIREAVTKIDSARAVYQKALGDIASTEKEIADIQAKQKVQVQSVLAPIDGFILKLTNFQGGKIVSAGQPLLELVPRTADRAVEIKVDGNDAPLVASLSKDGKHRKVRLQFEGWPAVQFSGWPSVAVGTFGGIVTVVDSMDDGMGKFRVLVLPDPDESMPWPTAQVLRQGIRARAWILLDRVTIGQELWRQLNGFPPAIQIEDPKAAYEDKLLRGKK
ncbi:MAG: toxin secretion protein [Planctomyces sp.]|nr:toxin secretion protein [Planctomyces sp.]